MEQFGNRMDFFKKTTDEAPEECISRAVNDPTPFGRLDLQLWEVGRARNQNHWALRPFMEDPYFRCYYIAEGRGKLRTLDGTGMMLGALGLFLPSFRLTAGEKSRIFAMLHETLLTLQERL